jgi:hypothetical protein
VVLVVLVLVVVVLVVLVVVVVGGGINVVVVVVVEVVVVVVPAVITLKGTTLQPTVKVATVKVLGVAELVCLTSTKSLLLTVPATLVQEPLLILYSPPVILIGVAIFISYIPTTFEVYDVLNEAPVTSPNTKLLGQISPA